MRSTSQTDALHNRNTGRRFCFAYPLLPLAQLSLQDRPCPVPWPVQVLTTVSNVTLGHISRNTSDPYETFLAAAGELWLFRLVDHHIVTRHSNFGALGALWARRTRIYSVDRVVGPPGGDIECSLLAYWLRTGMHAPHSSLEYGSYAWLPKEGQCILFHMPNGACISVMHCCSDSLVFQSLHALSGDLWMDRKVSSVCLFAAGHSQVQAKRAGRGGGDSRLYADSKQKLLMWQSTLTSASGTLGNSG
jgi:hypothetical protein